MSRPFQDLVAELPPEQQERIAELSRTLIAEAMLLRELRFEQDLTQEQLATMMGIRQTSLSKIEHQDDLLVSTLRRYVEALGGELEIHARFPDRTVALRRYGSTPTPEALPQPDLASVAR